MKKKDVLDTFRVIEFLMSLFRNRYLHTDMRKNDAGVASWTDMLDDKAGEWDYEGERGRG